MVEGGELGRNREAIHHHEVGVTFKGGADPPRRTLYVGAPGKPSCTCGPMIFTIGAHTYKAMYTPPAESPSHMPVPLKLTVCGLPGSLSLMTRAADRAPAALGLNAKLMVQFPSPATVLPAPQVEPD